MHVWSRTTIAILGGNTVAGLALSFLLRGAGYETVILKAPLADPTEDTLRDADLVIVSPDLHAGRRTESLAVLSSGEEDLRMPVLTFGSAVEKRLFAEDNGPSWPVEIGVLVREIEAALTAIRKVARPLCEPGCRPSAIGPRPPAEAPGVGIQPHKAQ